MRRNQRSLSITNVVEGFMTHGIQKRRMHVLWWIFRSPRFSTWVVDWNVLEIPLNLQDHDKNKYRTEFVLAVVGWGIEPKLGSDLFLALDQNGLIALIMLITRTPSPALLSEVQSLRIRVVFVLLRFSWYKTPKIETLLALIVVIYYRESYLQATSRHRWRDVACEKLL